MSEPHNIVVTHKPLDGIGQRVAGSVAGRDINLDYLRTTLEASEENLKLTEKALADPATKELAQAVRGALLGIEAISFHLLELHSGLAKGNINYVADPSEGYPGR